MNEKLKATRKRQRRLLGGVGDEILERALVGVGRAEGPEHKVDRRAVERRLRRLADQELPVIEAALTERREARVTAALRAIVDATKRPDDDHHLLQQIPPAPVRTTLEEWSATHFVRLLAWADDLADDGCRDPRLADELTPAR